MLGAFVFLVLLALGAMVQMALRATEGEDALDLGEEVTPGALALAAFVLLLMRALVDVHRAVLRDRALWPMLVSPVPEGAVRAGLMLRTLVFQMGLLATVMGTVVLVLATSPSVPTLPPELGPLVVMAGLASGALALPLLVNVLGARGRRDWAVAVVLLALAGAFFATLELDMVSWSLYGTGPALIAGSVLAAIRPGTLLAEAWAPVEAPQRSRRPREERMPVAFRVLGRGLDHVRAALHRREVTLNYGRRLRLSYVALNVVMCVSLIALHVELSKLAEGDENEWMFHALVTPFMVGMGVYAVVFFQVVLPLLDGFTREGPAIWVLRASPVDPRDIVAAKARPLLAFLPLTVVAVGVAIPYAGGRGSAAIVVAALGTVAVYLAFMGVGAWAGARYPNLDRHANAPPDLVLAFNLMVGCIVLEGLLLAPSLAIGIWNPWMGVFAAGTAVVLGVVIWQMGVAVGGQALASLEVG